MGQGSEVLRGEGKLTTTFRRCRLWVTSYGSVSFETVRHENSVLRQLSAAVIRIARARRYP